LNWLSSLGDKDSISVQRHVLYVTGVRSIFNVDEALIAPAGAPAVPYAPVFVLKIKTDELHCMVDLLSALEG
jgi:hypothetical protein